MQSMQPEVEPFGINTITVNPGFFRTELLTEESTNFAERAIEDYNRRPFSATLLRPLDWLQIEHIQVEDLESVSVHTVL
jgi:hypothetical protein